MGKRKDSTPRTAAPSVDDVVTYDRKLIVAWIKAKALARFVATGTNDAYTAGVLDELAEQLATEYARGVPRKADTVAHFAKGGAR